MNPRHAALLAAPLLTLALVGCTDDPPPEPASTPAQTPSIVPAVLAPPTYTISSMPVRPGLLPTGAQVGPAFDLHGWRLSYPDDDLELRITYADPATFEVGPRGSATPVQMLGTEGGEYTVTVAYQTFTVWSVTGADGQSVFAYGGDAEKVRRFAAALEREPMPIPVPFEPALLPEGFVPVQVAQHGMEFAPSGDVRDEREHVSVSLTARGIPQAQFGTPTTISGRPAQMRVHPQDGVLVILSISDDVSLTMIATPGLHLDEEQARLLVEGITITDDAVPRVVPD